MTRERPTQLNVAAVAVSIEMLKHRITVVTVLGHVRAAQHEQCRSFAVPFHTDMVEVEETLAGNRGLQIWIGEQANAIRNTLERDFVISGRQAWAVTFLLLM